MKVSLARINESRIWLLVLTTIIGSVGTYLGFRFDDFFMKSLGLFLAIGSPIIIGVFIWLAYNPYSIEKPKEKIINYDYYSAQPIKFVPKYGVEG